MIQLSAQQRQALGVIAIIALVSAIALIFGAISNSCEQRKIEKHEANVSNDEVKVEQSEKKVEAAKQDAAEVKGEVKVLKEVIRENNAEVNKTSQTRREAAANRARVRANPLRNVNGTELNRILTEAERNANAPTDSNRHDQPGRR